MVGRAGSLGEGPLSHGVHLFAFDSNAAGTYPEKAGISLVYRG
jgi:hypothetical protein